MAYIQIVDIQTQKECDFAESKGYRISVPGAALSGICYDFNGDGKTDYLYYESYDVDYYESSGLGYAHKVLSKDFRVTDDTKIFRFRDCDIFYFAVDASLISFDGKTMAIIDNIVIEGRFFPIDADNDGQIDFINKNEDVFTISTDGKFYKSKLKVYTPPIEDADEEETGRTFITMDYSQLSPSAVMGQMFGRDGGGSSGSSGGIGGGSFQASDLNGDGIPDFVNFNSGNAYYGLPNGMFVNEHFDGQMFLSDFNSDGINDYVLFHDSKLSVNLIKPDGSISTKDLIKGFRCSNIWCRDVDNDGDPDMIMALNGSQNFLAVFANDGKGNFKRHEAALPDNCGEFIDCIDYDNDGNYEVLTDKFTAFKINGIKVDTTPIDLHTLIDKDRYPDFASDGKKHKLILDPETGRVRLGGNYVGDNTIWLNTPENARPSAPEKVPEIIYETSTGLLKISWGTGADATTPASDLTYNLRIGSSADSDDILATNSSAEGIHWLREQGNMGKLHQRIINTRSWHSGTYYISVQTIDGNFRGSEFSKPAIFEKTEPDNDFMVAHRNPLNILDTIDVVVKSPLSTNTIEWDLDGGRILSFDEATGVYKITFDTPGLKAVSMQTTDSSGRRSASVSKEIYVTRGTAHVASLTSLKAAFDIDEDGVPEYSNYMEGAYGYTAHKFYQRDGNGGYEAIPKMFNSQNDVSKIGEHPLTADINNDGLCDLWSYNSNKFVYSINLGDMDMESSSVEAYNPWRQDRWIDFNNDGRYDIIMSGNLWLNDGTYNKFTSTGLYADYYYDYDCDGLIDVITRGFDENGPCIYIFQNYGEATVRMLDTINVGNYKYLLGVEDFDGDGAIDFLLNDCIVWNDGTRTNLPEELPEYYKFHPVDIDNNGTIDISNRMKVMYVLPDRQIQLEDYSDDDWSYGTYLVSFDTDYDEFGNFFRGANDSLRNHLLDYKINNTLPTAPTNLRHSQNDRFVTVEWTAATDKETPASHLLYNVSIKRVGAEGEGAYLFSPANSGKNGVPLPSTKPLLQGTKLKIPVANIPAGDYEVKIQTRDMAYATSNFSDTYIMHVNPTASFDIPATGEVNVPVSVKLLINTDMPVDYDGGVDQGQVSGVHQVVWSSPGTKVLKVGDATATIYIQPAPDGSFDLPTAARKGDRINLNGKLMNAGLWEGCELFSMWAPGGAIASEINLHDLYKKKELSYVDESNAVLTVWEYGTLRVKHSVASAFSTQTYSQEIHIDADPDYSGNAGYNQAETPSTLRIDHVTADPATGRYKLEWTLPEKHRSEATGINIYREGSITEKYELLATLPLNATEYIDLNSNPDIKAERYLISYELDYGTSRFSKPHQPVHVMINRGAGSSWNLIWGSYTGAKVQQYRILRGESPESLTSIANVSGNISSYTDFNAPTSVALYYAVETVFDIEQRASAPSKKSTHKSNAPRSNVVAAVGSNITLAESLQVFSETGETTIDTNNKRIQLIPLISPVTTTFGRVAWSVISGDNLVTVDNTGRIVATGEGNGMAVVRATTIDGSGLTVDVTITVTGISGLENIRCDVMESLRAFPSPAISTVTIDGLSGNDVDLYVFSLGGSIVKHIRTDASSVTFDCTTWAPGIYIAKSVDTASRKEAIVKFIKR